MPAVQKALIVGGGIGGLTAGVALRRAGVDVDLVELNPDFRVYGVGIIQPNNTLRALDRIGLARACVDAGSSFRGWRLFDAAGSFLTDAPTSDTAAPGYPPVNGITRPKLHEILSRAAVEAGVAITFGDTVDALEDDGQGVDVGFASGRAGRYDLVVGCDGTYSSLRGRLFGDDPAPAFTGQGVWRYNLPKLPGMDWGHLYFGADSKVGLVPMSDTLMYMLLVTAEPAGARFCGPDSAAAMRQRLGSYTGPVAELARQIVDPEAVVYRPMEPVLAPAPWMKGRTLLIGDAAHTTTPHLAQGAAMAIEDAVLLGELMARDADVPALLDEFMARRFDRCRFVIESSVQIGAWELEAWGGITNPDADQGALLHSATLALMDEY